MIYRPFWHESDTNCVPTEHARIRDARPAGPPPTPAAEAIRVDRRVSSLGSIAIARQKIHLGIGHAGRTVTVEDADTTFRVYDGGQLLADVPRTTTKAIARIKARRPEPVRRPAEPTPPSSAHATDR
ncbi:MAG: hypothetical protein ACRDGH_13165, partial [Candidatus Limnocylindria bacterium]